MLELLYWGKIITDFVVFVFTPYSGCFIHFGFRILFMGGVLFLTGIILDCFWGRCVALSDNGFDKVKNITVFSVEFGRKLNPKLFLVV